MINKLREFTAVLNEELKYHEGLLAHLRGLETNLWGLEEHASLPEVSSPEDQKIIINEINSYRKKISSCKKVIEAHSGKMVKIISTFQS